MERKKSTKHSSGSCGAREAADRLSPDLELPEADHFRSMPPRVSMAQMMRRSQELRRWLPQGIPSAEERWRAKTADEFHL